MPSCSACGSSSSSMKREDKVKLGISFHKFPKRNSSPVRFKKWTEYCKRENFVPSTNAVLCSLHFTKQDFEPSQLLKKQLMKNEKLQGPRLKSGTVPTVKLGEIARPASKFANVTSEGCAGPSSKQLHSTRAEGMIRRELVAEILPNLKKSEKVTEETRVEFTHDNSQQCFTRNCNSECQLSDIKPEMDLDCNTKVKLEAEVVIKGETDKCNVKDEIHPTHHLDPLSCVKSEVKENRILDTCDKSLLKEDETVVYDSHSKDLFEEKCVIPTHGHTGMEAERYNKNVINMENTQGKYKSEVCNDSLANIYNVHTNTVTGQNSLTCNVCGMSFSDGYQLTQHMRTHKSEKSFKCDICCKSFTQKCSLINHIRIHTKEKPFKCEICSKSFTQKSHLIMHAGSHTNLKPFKCSLCCKSFRHKLTLTRHMHTHTNEEPFKCNICYKSFSQKCNLTDHADTHTNEKFKYDTCFKTLSQKICVPTPVSAHTMEKQFICEICSKSFMQKFQLAAHIRCHMNEKLFVCSYCNKSFRCKPSFTIHLYSHKSKMSNPSTL